MKRTVVADMGRTSIGNSDTAMSSPEIRPRKWWYGVSIVIVLAGGMIYVAFFGIFFSSLIRGIEQIVVPGVHRLQLHHAGRYVIYHEYQSVVGDKAFSTNRNVVANLTCSIQGPDDAEEIPVSPMPPHASYQFGGKRKAISVFEFRITHPGTYILRAKYTDGRGGPRVVLGVARKSSERVLVPWIAFTVYTVAIIGISGGIFWITFFRRRRATRGAKVQGL